MRMCGGAAERTHPRALAQGRDPDQYRGRGYLLGLFSVSALVGAWKKPSHSPSPYYGQGPAAREICAGRPDRSGLIHMFSN
jgi:hypothetical protein